jgi:hypothetical protein
MEELERCIVVVALVVGRRSADGLGSTLELSCRLAFQVLY